MDGSVEEKQELLSIPNLKDRALENALRFSELRASKLEVRNDLPVQGCVLVADQQQRRMFLRHTDENSFQN